MRFFLRMAKKMDSIALLSKEDFTRVNVVGTSSSGKSTFSKRLSRALDVPYIEMDLLFHGPNWTEPTLEVFRERIKQAVANPFWVLDGNYHSKTHDVKWSRATLIIWLDIPLSANIFRAFRRAIQRSWSQEELWPGTGNRETFRKTFFSTDSMILWTAMSHSRLRKRYSNVQADPPAQTKFVRVRKQAQLEQLIKRAQLVR